MRLRCEKTRTGRVLLYFRNVLFLCNLAQAVLHADPVGMRACPGPHGGYAPHEAGKIQRRAAIPRQRQQVDAEAGSALVGLPCRLPWITDLYRYSLEEARRVPTATGVIHGSALRPNLSAMVGVFAIRSSAAASFGFSIACARRFVTFSSPACAAN